MNKSSDTKQLLLANACKIFWSKGYSNVSVREIAKAAGVDVALIARYFGSKRGLFEATFDNLTKTDQKLTASEKGCENFDGNHAVKRIKISKVKTCFLLDER